MHARFHVHVNGALTNQDSLNKRSRVERRKSGSPCAIFLCIAMQSLFNALVFLV